MYDHRFLTLSVSAEENRCSENTLKRRHQTPVLRSSLLHAERIEHLRRAAKANHATLLTYRERRKEERNQPVLPPRQSVRGMPGYLKQKMSISPFVEELASVRSLYGESAQYEGTGGKPEILISLLTFQADTGDRVRTPEFLF